MASNAKEFTAFGNTPLIVSFYGTGNLRAMTQLLRFHGSQKNNPAIEVWMIEHTGELGTIARHWFDVIRNCGDDVRELLHDGHPTARIEDAAFA